MDNIERLYKCYEVLSEAGDKISEVSYPPLKKKRNPRNVPEKYVVHILNCIFRLCSMLKNTRRY